jgi:hypothetical protein
MGNLSNLYISQSFQSLIHLGNDGTASAALTELQDGFGNGIKISVNNVGDLKLDGALSASTITALNQSTASLNAFTASQTNLNATYATTGSNNFVGNQNINGNASITGSLVVTGEITANKLNVIIESSSVIFSSGSNILGDAPTDTQTLNGTVYSNGNLYVTGEMSASSVSGIGNAHIYSASVSNRLNNIEYSTSSLNNFSSSTNLYTASVNTFSASTLNRLSSIETFTASANLRLNALETFSSSTNARLNSIEIVTASLAGTNAFTASIAGTNTFTASIAGTNAFTASIKNTNAFTASNGTAALNSFTASIATTNTFTASMAGTNTFTSSATLRLNSIEAVTASLNAKTGSLASTGSNIFTGSQTITGSVYGNVASLTITSNTASLDLSRGNFFTLALVSGSATRVEVSNIRPGQTTNMILTQPAVGTGTVTFSSLFAFPVAYPYVASAVTSSSDILTFVSFTTASLFATAVKNLK